MTNQTRSRPGGRTERVRRQVAEAVLALIGDGAELTPASVSERAGVHRATVYRRWPTEVDLLREALTAHTAQLTVPDTGAWHTDLLATARTLARLINNPIERAMNAALVSSGNSELRRISSEQWGAALERFRVIVDRAVTRGEIRPDTDPAMIWRLLISPLIVETMFVGREPDESFVERLAATVAGSCTVGPA